jgi:hypothetical protein
VRAKRDEFCAASYGFHAGGNDRAWLQVFGEHILNERGYNGDVIEAVLCHQDDDEIRRICNRGRYCTQRVKLMNDCAELIEFLKGDRS